MRLSSRILEMQESPIRKLTPYADEAEKKKVKIYHLNIGQPDIDTPPEMMDAIKNTDFKILKYGPSDGLKTYRNALPKYYAKYGIKLAPEDILVTTAGSEAILFAMIAVADVGEEIIITEPYYTNYNGFATMADVKIVPVTTKAETGFAPPPIREIEEKITNRTRAILICNPSNPTGAVYSREEVKSLVQLCKTEKLFLIADEVYREFVYDGYKHTSIMEFPEIVDRAIMVDSISKRYSACGARIGCIISKNHELMQNVLKLGQARLCPPTLEQIAAQAAIDLPETYFDKTLAEYQRRRDIVYKELKNTPGVFCEKPKGAFYIIAKLPVENAEDFAIYMLKHFRDNNETVMFSPADGFYGSKDLGKDEIRIAYVLNANDLKRAMELFKKGLEQYKLDRKS
ncbi:MAG: aspartate aminotransferase [Candidatus Schekmanbacteria bacterium RBG_13_48_7]|uniref:Aminotransferase n=1 Tax=Candidatus Schekmanbacteria bacterium RBG_13_48_7 TaxID=1817878 RepID=A0A1F7RVD5_9BACT|nr:MAG: aspartate aminotransferase [Candidatus Schekmanbacteria bacterium RBG_13_48_7]